MNNLTILVPLCFLISVIVVIGGAWLMSCLVSMFIIGQLGEIIGAFIWILILIGFFANRIQTEKF
jgi:hypothetical protein